MGQSSLPCRGRSAVCHSSSGLVHLACRLSGQSLFLSTFSRRLLRNNGVSILDQDAPSFYCTLVQLFDIPGVLLTRIKRSHVVGLSYCFLSLFLIVRQCVLSIGSMATTVASEI